MVLKEASYCYPIFVNFGHDGALNVTKSIITCNHQFPVIPPYKYHANMATEVFLVKCSRGGIYAKFSSGHTKSDKDDEIYFHQPGSCLLIS